MNATNRPQYWWHIMASKHPSELPFSGYYFEVAQRDPRVWIELGPEDLEGPLDAGDDFQADHSDELEHEVSLEPWGDESWMVEEWFAAGDEEDFLDAPMLLDAQPDDSPIGRTVRWIRQAVRARLA